MEIGISLTIEKTTCEQDSAQYVKSGRVNVFATPMMIALMEQTAATLVQTYLEEGQTTVGTAINTTHIAATPIGMKVHATATLVQIENRALTFEIKAYDEKECIGEASHTRFIINQDKFEEKVQSK
ncbi:MAG: thioesterase family protein [Erysipelotrichaceae bacterium]